MQHRARPQVRAWLLAGVLLRIVLAESATLVPPR
jgi:hypothetical protein